MVNDDLQKMIDDLDTSTLDQDDSDVPTDPTCGPQKAAAINKALLDEEAVQNGQTVDANGAPVDPRTVAGFKARIKAIIAIPDGV
jgi:hypothetical protein